MYVFFFICPFFKKKKLISLNQFEPRKVDRPAPVADPDLVNMQGSDSADEWESDPEDDQLDDEEEETELAAAIILEREQEELSALWAQSARTPLDSPTLEEDRLGRSAMRKIIKIGQCCARKGPLQKTWARYCKLKNVPKLKMVKRVPTRWNTMYNVVHRAWRLRKALDAMCNGAPLRILIQFVQNV